jgi:thiosulfate reductase cytochrome b subunit
MPTDAVMDAPAALDAKPPLVRREVRRHSLVVRITHWVNVLALTLMLLSGLNIFNAHSALYWGSKSTFDKPWLSIQAEATPKGWRGVTAFGPWKFDTTGVLGASKVKGAMQPRAFPAWATLPSNTWLSLARRWHFFWAWVFAINGLIYIGSALLGGRLKRDLLPTGHDIRDIPRDLIDHARFKFPKGWEATRYHVLQKLAYVGTAFLVLPLIVLTGMTMSPGLNAAFPFLLDIFGGRQSARSIHFICAVLIVAFIIVHLVMVLLTNPLNQIRAMITGKFAIKVREGEEAPP